MQRPLGAQISHMLKARGVDVIFGIPGVHNQEMYRGIEEAGITHVLARHEQGAGFMADGYARASGRPGVAYVITGPGVCNIMTPMGQAYSDSVPMLVLSSCLDETAAQRGQLHQMKDQAGAARTVCGWSEQAAGAEAVYALIDRALTEFSLDRPRPKHITVPIAALEGAAPKPPERTGLPARTGAPDVAAACDAMIAARRPIVIAGGGARHAANEVRELADKLGAARFATYAGRGTFAPDDPLYFGSMLARPGSVDVLARADLIIAVGTELSEVDLWRNDPGHDCSMIRVDIDPEVLAGAEIPICADAAAAMAALLEVCPAEPHAGWSPAEVAEARWRWRGEVDAATPGVVPVCEALQDVLPADTMIFSDMTQIAYAAKELWDMPAPGLWHHPSGFGTLGYALPAAIGGAVARPGKPTLAIAGDYGFQYTLQELGTAVELKLPLPILIWDNGKLKEIEDSMTRAQIAPNAVQARNPDFCALARAYGAAAERPGDLAEMRAAVTRALSAEGPTLIHVDAGIAR